MGKTVFKQAIDKWEFKDCKFTIFAALFSAIVSVDARGTEVGDDGVCNVVDPLGHAHGRDAAAAGLAHVAHLPAVIHVMLLCN